MATAWETWLPGVPEPTNEDAALATIASDDERAERAVVRAEDRLMERRAMEALLAAEERHEPTTAHDRTQNQLRPVTFADVVGQDDLKRLLERVVERCADTGRPLDHMLLIGPSGMGKSTLSHVMAEALDVDVYEVEAPASHATLLSLREVMRDGDILRVEEIHQQAIMERRGKSAATQPEVLYAVMEDRVIATPQGPLPYPHITIIGTTTDEGMLPDAFINRFPLRPTLEPYTNLELELLAKRNARKLDLRISSAAARVFAQASRGVPRQVNNFIRNADALSDNGRIRKGDALEVVRDLNRTTEDGLTPDMVNMLSFIYTRAKRTSAKGDVYYQASVNTIATAIGKSRDSKAIALRVEPYLIERGYVQVTSGGRRLTDEGVNRARALTKGRS